MNDFLKKQTTQLIERHGLKLIWQHYKKPLYKWRDDKNNHVTINNLNKFNSTVERKGIEYQINALGVDCEFSSILVIDRDDMVKSMKVLIPYLDELNNTFSVKTKKGMHHYFKISYPNDIKSIVYENDGFDVKATGGLVTAAGSAHEKGGFYQIEINKEIQPISEQLLAFLLDKQKEKQKERQSLHCISDGATIPKGNRNETLFSIGLNICRRLSVDSSVLLSNLMLAYNQKCDPPFTDKEIVQLSNRAFHYHINHFTPEEDFDIYEFCEGQTMYSDRTVLNEICQYCLGKVFYSYDDRKFYVFDGIQWVEDKNNSTTNCINVILSKYWRELDKIKKNNPEMYKEKHLDTIHKKIQSNGFFASMRKVMETAPEITTETTKLNRDPFLFNTKNCTLNLAKHVTQRHNPFDYITMSSGVGFNTDKKKLKSSRFEQFLNDIFTGNQELINFIKCYLGYCLTGSTKEQKFLIFHGSGRNGKSTLVNVIAHILGDYMKHTPQDTLMHSKNAKQTNDLAGLFGARLVIATETGAGKALDEERIKEISGGDPITCRKLYGDFFTYKPEFKIIMTTNHKPRLFNTDFSMRRRVCLVPFNYTVSDKDVDSNLEETLKKDESGIILNWLLDGLKEYQSNGLTIPQCVTAETDEYFNNEDAIARFLDENTERNESCKIKCSELYEKYREWCRINKEYDKTNRQFIEALKLKGIERKRRTDSTYYLGLRKLLDTEYSYEIYEENEQKEQFLI